MVNHGKFTREYGLGIQMGRLSNIQANLKKIREDILGYTQPEFADLLALGRSTYTKLEQNEDYKITRIHVNSLMAVLDYEKNKLISIFLDKREKIKLKYKNTIMRNKFLNRDTKEYDNKIKDLIDLVYPEIWKKMKLSDEVLLDDYQINEIRKMSFAQRWVSMIYERYSYLKRTDEDEELTEEIENSILVLCPLEFDKVDVFKNMIDDLSKVIMKCKKRFFIDVDAYNYIMDNRLNYYRDEEWSGYYNISKILLNLQHNDLLIVEHFFKIIEMIDNNDNLMGRGHLQNVIFLSGNYYSALAKSSENDYRLKKFLTKIFYCLDTECNKIFEGDNCGCNIAKAEEKTAATYWEESDLDVWMGDLKWTTVWIYESKDKIRRLFNFDEYKHEYEDVLKYACLSTVSRLYSDPDDIFSSEEKKMFLELAIRVFEEIFEEDMFVWINRYLDNGEYDLAKEFLLYCRDELFDKERIIE